MRAALLAVLAFGALLIGWWLALAPAPTLSAEQRQYLGMSTVEAPR